MKTCSIEGCERKHKGKKLCAKHTNLARTPEERAKQNKALRERYASDPEYKQKTLAYQKKWYYNNIERVKASENRRAHQELEETLKELNFSKATREAILEGDGIDEQLAKLKSEPLTLNT